MPHTARKQLVQLIAQLRQWQRRHFQHIDAAQRRQPHAQCLTPQAIVVGGAILLGETTGDQRLQVAVHLARRHLHVLGQARQRGRRRQFGEGLEDVGADFRRADFLLAVVGGELALAMVGSFRIFASRLYSLTPGGEQITLFVI